MEILSYLIIFFSLYYLTKHLLHKYQKLPPSPFPGLPIIGHLHLLKKPLHRSLARISQDYGPVLFLEFGSRPALLVSSPSAAEECFTKNDVAFANRPRLLAGKYLGYDYTTLVWASYGQHWRNLRRIASVEILSNHRLQMLSGIRADEVRSVLHRLYRVSHAGDYTAIDMKSVFFDLTLKIMMRMIAGKGFYGEKGSKSEEARKLKEIVSETFQVSGATNIGDFLPPLRWVRVSKLEKRLKVLQEKRDGFLQDLVEEHRKMRADSVAEQRSEKTMIDVLLLMQEEEPEYYTDHIIRGMMQVIKIPLPYFFSLQLKN